MAARPIRMLLDTLRARNPQEAEISDQSDEDVLYVRPASLAVLWNFILVWFMLMLVFMWIA